MRLLRSNPGFSTVAIGTVALAIGVNTAMFGFVNGILLRPLPYPESDRIVRVLERHPTGSLNSISTLNYLDWARQNTVFEHLAAEAGWRATLTGGDEPELLRGALVTAHYFDIFGTRPALGRTFVPEHEQVGRDRVVLLSHALWQRRFGSDPAVVGRAIPLNGEPHTVLGVIESGPFDRAAAQIWKPLAFRPANQTRDFRWLAASARLKDGVTLEQARAEMDVIAQRLGDAYPESNSRWGIAADRLADVLIGPELRMVVTVLFAATTFVLLIGCANLANLALARGMWRQSEMAVRSALGAGRWRLIRQLLVENLFLSVCGGIMGVGVASVLMQWILSLIPPDALPPAVEIGMNTTVLLFSLAAVVVTGLLFGLAPAAQATQPSLIDALKHGGYGAAGGRQGSRIRGGLVVTEIVLAFVLLVASGLLLRSVLELRDVDPGFQVQGVLTAGLPISEEQHPDPVELNAYLASIRSAVEAVPGIRATAVTSALPLEGWGYGVAYSIDGREVPVGTVRRPAFFKMVSPSYFETLGIRLLAGRVLGATDTAGAPPVALINDTLVRREFPDEDPIGRRILARQIVPGATGLGKEIAWEIVGIIAGEKVTGLGDEISAGMYVSNLQSPVYDVHLIVRADVPAQALHTAVQSAVERANPGQALSDIRTLEEIVAQSMLGNRVLSTVLSAFAALALLLAAGGLYGLIAYTAARRAHEMGIRAALGASAGKLRLLVVREGMRLTAIGLSIGLAATVLTADAMSSLLYGVGALDPLTLVGVGAVLAGTAGLACLLPAWRMTKADPMEALRSQ